MKIIQTTDGRHVGKDAEIGEDSVTIGSFSFVYTAQVGNRIIGPNYSITVE